MANELSPEIKKIRENMKKAGRDLLAAQVLQYDAINQFDRKNSEIDALLAKFQI